MTDANDRCGIELTDRDDTHALREAAQLLIAHPSVRCVDVLTADHPTPRLKATLVGGAVPSAILSSLGRFGLSLDPDATATRGNPVHTRLVAHP